MQLENREKTRMSGEEEEARDACILRETLCFCVLEELFVQRIEAADKLKFLP